MMVPNTLRTGSPNLLCWKIHTVDEVRAPRVWTALTHHGYKCPKSSSLGTLLGRAEAVIHSPGSAGGTLDSLTSLIEANQFENSPPQMRRGGAKRRGGADQGIDFLEQHHPSGGFPLLN